jgi:hypothetical protein
VRVFLDTSRSLLAWWRAILELRIAFLIEGAPFLVLWITIHVAGSAFVDDRPMSAEGRHRLAVRG